MSKTGWIVLLVAGTCVAFVVGLLLGKGDRREAEAERVAGLGEVETTVMPRDSSGGAGLDELRVALAEKEDRIAALESELTRLRGDLGVLAFEEDEEELEMGAIERALVEKWDSLRNGLLQRKDKALRAESVDELAALLASGNRSELEVGLGLVRDLRHVECDKEKLRAPVLSALRHEDSQIRSRAITCIDVVCPVEELPAALLEPLSDSSAEVRRGAASIVGRYRELAQNDGLLAAVETLLKDDDEDVRGAAIRALWRRPEYGTQMEDAVIELSEEWGWRISLLLPREVPISARLAQRLAEIYDESVIFTPGMHWGEIALSEEAKPIAVAHSLRVVRNDTELHRRLMALRSLRDVADASVLAELEKIAASNDAEGIEEQLGETIEHLRQQANQPK